ncbi:MAG TPA: hypothetical protein DCY75_04540, partial [Clostridiales bacterium]|nr:hypothetical protein [Clostridiales bacterium]
IADDIDMDALGEEFPAMAQEKETDVPTQEESENELSENGGGKTVLTQTESIDGEGKTEA